MSDDAAAWDDFAEANTKRSLDSLRRIARYQRWIIAVVLAQLALVGYVALAELGRGRAADTDFPIALALISGGVGAAFVFMLSWELRGAFAAIAFGLATLVPVMGVLILTLVNGYASAELKKHGLKVGIFGANFAEVQDRPVLYDIDDAGW